MSALDRFALVAAAAGDALHPAQDALWRRYRDPRMGLSLEVPFEMAPESEASFDTLVVGRMTMPFVFDVAYMASFEGTAASPEALARDLAMQWMVDYDLAVGPTVRLVQRPGIDEAWAVRAEIEDAVGTLGYTWLVLRKGDRIGCVGISCWTVEIQGREALARTFLSVSGE